MLRSLNGVRNIVRGTLSWQAESSLCQKIARRIQARVLSSGPEDIIEREDGPAYITGHSLTAFAVTGDRVVDGPMFLCGKSSLRAHVARPSQLPSECLAILDVTRPPPDLVILGTGKSVVPPSREIEDELGKRDVAWEVMDTRSAVGAYNVLVQEGRNVAAFLWPAGAEDGAH